MDSVAATCRWIAAVRAVESERPDRLFHDPYAKLLAGETGFMFLERMRADNLDGGQDTNLAYIVHRTRFLDDMIQEATAAGIRQLVILACGMDTRAFRLGLPADMHVFEADLPEVIAVKEAALREAGAQPTCRRTVLSLDLREAWTKPLVAAGFDPSQSAIWLVEGLLMYLEEPDVRRLFELLGSLAAPGSHIGTDLINATFLTFKGTQRLRSHLQDIQAPWRWGTDDPEQFFAGLGWQVEAVQPGELPFGRWSLKVFPREKPGISRLFFVHGIRVESC